MKKQFAVFLFLGWLMSAGMAWAEPPVLLSHTLTGYTTGADSATLSYTLNVQNTGAGSLSDLVLSLEPLSVMSQDQIKLNIATLDPQAEVQLPFTLTTHMPVEQEAIRNLPLFWVCEGAVVDIGPVMFPVASVEGGAL
jgi:hypothetical protein